MIDTAQKKIRSFEDLIVYQKAKLLTLEVVRYFSTFKLPKTQEFVIIQLLRAVSSIGANIAEGYGRLYKNSYRQFLSIARGSCFESKYWFDITLDMNLFDSTNLNNFRSVNEELAKMLTTMMKNLERSPQD